MNTSSQPKNAGQEARVSIAGVSAELLRNLFLHHDGIVVGATVAALDNGGILKRLFQQRRLSMAELRDGIECNPGYLHVALRCLALQGWINRQGPPASDAMVFEITPIGKMASVAFDLYSEAAAFVYSGRSMDSYLFNAPQPNLDDFEPYRNLVDKSIAGWSLDNNAHSSSETRIFETISRHLDGMLVAPFMIAAKSHGLLDGDQFPLNRFFGSKQNVEVCLRLLQHLHWIDKTSTGWCFNDAGRLACDFTLHYGLTWSYAPMFCNLSRLIFNSAKNVTHVEPGKEEVHVDRVINVLASGVAHRRYFEDSEKIIIDIFNRLPLQEQPRFVADMGCGDGAWLKQIYEVVQSKTERGRHLGEFPLTMIGADYNVKAQVVVRDTLNKAGIPNLILFGDVGDPAQFAAALKEKDINICDGLHVRAFIDHNRPYQKPVDINDNNESALSTGAYADENGNPIPNHELEQSLSEHLKKWVPYIQLHGLIILEAHNVEPSIAAQHIGKTHATAFDTYHGYSNQYPVDFEAFIRQAEKAGLRSVIYQQMLYPSRLPFVAISLNHFKTDGLLPQPKTVTQVDRGSKEWVPTGSEDLSDGNALHHLLYQSGDLSLPRRWSCYATGLFVAEVLDNIEKQWNHILKNKASSRSIKLVDYGVGTGFATLELIKGLQEKGLLNQFRQSGIEFQLLVVDFPSGWFAKAYELLQGYPFVSFYSLKDTETNQVRMLSDIVAKSSVDMVFASMVFHLVPPEVLPGLMESFAAVLKEGGTLLWNTPDTAPTLPHSQVIHAANRTLRTAMAALIDDEHKLDTLLCKIPDELRPNCEKLRGQLAKTRQALDPAKRSAAELRARKQILPAPTPVSTIEMALSDCFSGATWVKLSVMTNEELLALALLPANQHNVGIIEDRQLREQLIELLLNYEVLPQLRASPSGISAGMVLHWTFGKFNVKS